MKVYFKMLSALCVPIAQDFVQMCTRSTYIRNHTSHTRHL